MAFDAPLIVGQGTGLEAPFRGRQILITQLTNCQSITAAGLLVCGVLSPIYRSQLLLGFPTGFLRAKASHLSDGQPPGAAVLIAVLDNPRSRSGGLHPDAKAWDIVVPTHRLPALIFLQEGL